MQLETGCTLTPWLAGLAGSTSCLESGEGERKVLAQRSLAPAQPLWYYGAAAVKCMPFFMGLKLSSNWNA